MLHFGSSKHSSNFLGFGLSSKKKDREMTSFLALASFTASHLQRLSRIALGNSVAGRAAKKNIDMQRLLLLKLLHICRFDSFFFRFSMLVNFSLHIWIYSSFLGHGCGLVCSLSPVRIWRQERGRLAARAVNAWPPCWPSSIESLTLAIKSEMAE